MAKSRCCSWLAPVLLLAAASCSAISAPLPPRAASEVDDLLAPAASDSQHFLKKRAKNVSGKSDEGGFFKSFGSDADGEKGYVKKNFGKAGHGYKSLDTFHKTHGDKYGFAEHEAFDEPRLPAEGKKKSAKDHEGAGTDLESYYADESGGAEGYVGGYSSAEGSSYSGGGAGGGSGSSSSSGEAYYGGGDDAVGSFEAFSAEVTDGSYY